MNKDRFVNIDKNNVTKTNNVNYIIEAFDLVKKFGTVTAVERLSFRVPQGSIYGFLGKNGAGKTTTIKMLAALSRPTSGEIRICGEKVEFGRKNEYNSFNIRKKIGYLPDVPEFYNYMTAYEYLSLTGQLFRMDIRMIRERTEEVLNLVGLINSKEGISGGCSMEGLSNQESLINSVNSKEGIRSRRIGGYSRGMKQRLGIAQALLNQPEIVFFDEPTSALDPVGRKEVLEVITRLKGKTTVFLSSHILSDIERVCDRVLIIDKGKLMAEDSIQDLKSKYEEKIIEIEITQGTEQAKVQQFVKILSEMEWAYTPAIKEVYTILLPVNDIDKARLNIPKLLAGNDIPLTGFRLIEPALEDIFIKVVRG